MRAIFLCMIFKKLNTKTQKIVYNLPYQQHDDKNSGGLSYRNVGMGKHCFAMAFPLQHSLCLY
jgi:hypothetical protein